MIGLTLAARASARRRKPLPLVGADWPSRDEPDSDGGSAPADSARSAIARLPERQRLALFLRYYADLDYRTIALVLGVKEGTVSATLSAAHAAVRHLLEEVTS